MKQFVLQHANGSLVGVDVASGGYPFEAYNAEQKKGNLGNVRFFHSREAAEQYRGTFSEFEIEEFLFELK